MEGAGAEPNPAAPQPPLPSLPTAFPGGGKACICHLSVEEWVRELGSGWLGLGKTRTQTLGKLRACWGVLCIRSVSASARGLPLPSPGRLFPTELAVGPGGHMGWGWGMLIRASHAACCYLLRSWNAPHTTAVPPAKAGPRAPNALPPLLKY